MKWLSVEEMASVLSTDVQSPVYKYGNWIKYQEDNKIQAIYFEYSNNKVRVKNGLPPKPIKALEDVVLDCDKKHNLDTNADVVVDDETNDYMIETTSGLELYQD